MNKRIELAGKTFGRLYVVEYARCKNEVPYWLCRCVCGTVKEIDGQCLRSGKTVSCGCYRKENSVRVNSLPVGECAFNMLFNNYKGRARRRAQEFSLTKEEFSKLTKSMCTYCGVLPSQILNTFKSNRPYIYNGVDRVNSNEGYTNINSVPCCKTCNNAKMDLTLEAFMQWIDRLVKFRTQPESDAKRIGRNQ